MKDFLTLLTRFVLGEGEKRDLSPSMSKAIKGIAILTTLYSFWAVFGYPEAILHRSLCFGLFFALVFLLYTSPGSQTKNRIPGVDWLLAGLSVAVSIYIWVNADRLITRFAFVDQVQTADLIFCGITILLLLEGTRRVIGPWLSMLSMAAIAYALWGQHIPGIFGHNGFTVGSIVDELFLTTDGIWGNVLGIASTYIIIFIAFGAFLQNSGAGDFLFNFAASIAGRSRGGLAKVGIIASGLFGMISGSPTANVTSLGNVTIPMMKKTGYPSDFAAAVECCASTGGTIMPPVMGSVAFIMADVIGVPYIKVAAAAFIPALIYYAALLFTIDFRAGKLGMVGLPSDEIPPLGRTLLKGIIFFIPLIYLTVRLMAGYSPSRVGFETVILIFAVSWLRKENRMTLGKTLKALAEGTTQGIMVIVTMATSGILLGIINLTGLGTKFCSILIAFSGQSLFITLLLTMALAMFLGLAMNITPAYLLTAVIAGPVLIKLGVNPLAAHLFILFFAAMATMTPPVATTAFVAAGIAEASPMWVGFLSMRIALVAYIMPFIFIFQPALLLRGSVPAVILAGIAGLFAVAMLSMGVEGWFEHKLGLVSRFMLCAAGILALTGYPLTVTVAFVLAISVIAIEKIRHHRLAV